jgi:hypothetical protein
LGSKRTRFRASVFGIQTSPVREEDGADARYRSDECGRGCSGVDHEQVLVGKPEVDLCAAVAPGVVQPAPGRRIEANDQADLRCGA